MTQRERILSMLKDAGPKGVRSDEFFHAYMPRAAARIQELKDAGEPITTEREGKFVRYRLVEISARGAARDSPSMRKEALPIIASADLSEQLFNEKSPEVSRMYDPYSEAA